jgi:hypothetical protein
MTFVAGIAFREVQTVAEDDEFRYSIDSRPAYILILFRQGCHLLARRTRGLDSVMATHARRKSYNTHVLAGVRIRVARLARYICIGVHFMAERQRLSRRLGRCILGAKVEGETH